MVTQDGEAQRSASIKKPTTDRDQDPGDRFKRLPPAVSITTAIAMVGVVPTLPLGPEGGGDGD